MIVDVLINSCARPDVLAISVRSFQKYIKTTHELRYIILEDKVDDERRQNKGVEWIVKNKNLFYEIHFSKKKLGPGFFFAPIVKLCKTDFFFHLEDDNEFTKDINIDPLIEVMKNNQYIAEVVLRRGVNDRRNHPKNVIIDGMKFTEMDIFSVATGVFNTKNVKCIIDKAGWNRQLREVWVLGPIAHELGFKKYTWGFNKNKPQYIHAGPKKGYRKGSWK